MARVRSKKLGSYDATSASGFHTLYTTPSGHRTIVKQASVANRSGADAVVEVYTADGASFGIVLLKTTVPDGGDVIIDDAWVVIDQGDELAVGWSSSSAGHIYFWASGAELELP